jgi:hypothetical protein
MLRYGWHRTSGGLGDVACKVSCALMDTARHSPHRGVRAATGFKSSLKADRLRNVSRIFYDWLGSTNWTPTCPRSRRFTRHHRLSPARSSRTNSSGKDSESSISRSAPPLETSTKVQGFGIMTNAERFASRRAYFRFSTAMSRCPLIEEIAISSDVN